MLCACLHKTYLHTYIRTHSVSDDTRLSKLLTKNQGFASSIKHQHFSRSTPKFVHGKDSTSIRSAYPQTQGFVSYFCPIALQPSIKKICFTALTKSEISTNLGHKAGGASSGQKVLTIERSLMSGWGQGHEVLLQSHETKSGMESLGLSYISFYKQLLQPKVSLVAKRH